MQVAQKRDRSAILPLRGRLMRVMMIMTRAVVRSTLRLLRQKSRRRRLRSCCPRKSSLRLRVKSRQGQRMKMESLSSIWTTCNTKCAASKRTNNLLSMPSAIKTRTKVKCVAKKLSESSSMTDNRHRINIYPF